MCVLAGLVCQVMALSCIVQSGLFWQAILYLDMKKYTFTIPGMFGKLTAEKAAKELERISEEHNHELKPEYVVADAVRKSSPLHKVFEWDDTKAAEKYRLQQARHLMNHIRIEVVNENIECRLSAFVHVKKDEKSQRTYVPLQHVVLNDYAYKDMLEQAKEVMQSFVVTYSQIEEVNAVKAEMLKVLNS